MLGIDKEFKDRIEGIEWFENCGDYDNLDLGFDVKIAKNKEIAIRSFNSLHWGNTCLDKRGDFTVFLFLNHGDDYDKWNEIVEEVNDKYMVTIDKAILPAMKRNNLSEELFNEIHNIICIEYMLNYYSEFGYNESDFWDKLLIIFENGYLPCGWRKNEFLIY